MSGSEKKRLDILSQKLMTSALTGDEYKEYMYLLTLGFIANREKIDSILPMINVPRNQKTLQLTFKDVYKSKIDLRNAMVSFKGPVYIIDGRQDVLDFVGYEFKILFPSYELYWIQDCGHFPMYEQPESFYNIIFSILSKQ